MRVKIQLLQIKAAIILKEKRIREFTNTLFVLEHE